MYMTVVELEKNFDIVLYDFDEVNNLDIHWIDKFDKETDPINLIKNISDIRDYIAKPFELHQPKTYNYLSNGRFFYAIKKSMFPAIMSDISIFGVIINQQVFYIRLSKQNYESLGNTILLNNISIPIELLYSWFFRCNKWEQPIDITTQIYKSRLPSITQDLLGRVLYGSEKEDEKMVKEYKFLENKFKRKIKRLTTRNFEKNEIDFISLRCLLDTRSDNDYTPKGTQIFTSEFYNQKIPELYITPNADVFQVKKLSNPAEAIDSYAAHLFSRAEGEFDFMQYAEDF